MEFSDIILKYFNDNNIQPSAIAKATGIDKSTFSKWKTKPTSKIDFETVHKIVSYLNISVDTLLYGDKTSLSINSDEQQLISLFRKLTDKEQQRLIGRAELLVELSENNGNKKVEYNHMRRINIAYVAAGAGISTPFTIDNAFSEQEFPADEIPTGADCGVPINGDSMEPEYPNGCIVWVKQNADVKYGDCIIAVINGEPFFKIYKPDGLHSYNANYKPIIVNDSDQFEIFGKVIGYYSE